MCIPRELRPTISVYYMVQNLLVIKENIKCIYKDIQNYISNCKLYIKTNTGHSPNNPSNPLEIPNEASQTIHVELLKFLTPSSGYN